MKGPRQGRTIHKQVRGKNLVIGVSFMKELAHIVN